MVTRAASSTSRLPAVDAVYVRRSDGKAPVRIGRAWHGNIGGHEDDYVRCHPVNGGKWWFTTVEEFDRRYEGVGERG